MAFTQHPLALAVALALIAASIAFLEFSTVHPSEGVSRQALANVSNASSSSVSDKLGRFPQAVEFVSPSGFINSDNFTLRSLIGKKVILLDFWTYSCINCVRTIPYLNAWYSKYKGSGLEIIGVHTPEFAFEKEFGNVQLAVKKFGIQYPVVLDSDYGTWSAYNNEYWPAEYLIDIDGFVIRTHFGEGEYDQTEAAIQAALAERASRLNLLTSFNNNPVSLPAESPKAQSPETYFGSARNQFLANGAPGVAGVQNFSLPSQIEGNKLYLGGSWNITPEYAVSMGGSSEIAFAYFAKGIYFVAAADSPVTLTVLLDGKPVPATLAGADVNMSPSASTVTISEPRLYRLVQDSSGPSIHEIELIAPAGLKAFTFTFG